MKIPSICWVAEDGSFGTGELVIFDGLAFTDEHWALLEELSDSERIKFAEAVVLGKSIEQWKGND